MTIRVELYTRHGCCLCDEARAVLLRVRRDMAFDLREIDVELSPALEAAYGERIPFVVVNGRPAFKFHVTEEALRRRLERERTRPQPG